MTSPPGPGNGEPEPSVDLTKDDTAAEAPFDPYRFGLPDHPVPPEYAPPGYTPPTPAAAPPPSAPPAGTPYPPYPPSPYGPYGQQPYGQQQYGPQQYGPQQYGPPRHTGQPYGPPGGWPGYGPPQQGHGKATAAMVLGIVSIVMCWTSFFDAIFVVLALIFGIIALGEARARGGAGRGQAVAGLVCCAVGAVLAIVVTVVIVHAANQCGGFGQDNDPSYQQCVQDKL